MLRSMLRWWILWVAATIFRLFFAFFTKYRCLTTLFFAFCIAFTVRLGCVEMEVRVTLAASTSARAESF